MAREDGHQPDAARPRLLAAAHHPQHRGIESGRLAPGAKFADSRDLAEDWEVAYQTVRRAMAELRQRGLVVSRVGKGTFVVGAQGR